MDYNKNFGDYLKEKGKAKKTIESYTGDLRGYFTFLSDRDIPFDGILNRFTIISYKNHLMQNHYEPVNTNKKLNRITREAKLPQKLKPHTFRHTFCTSLINKGVPPYNGGETSGTCIH